MREPTRPQVSRFSTLSAFCWMNSRRGSTSSPISFVKTSSASSSSSTRTCRSVRASGSRVVSQSWLGVHLAQALVALERQPLLALFAVIASSRLGRRVDRLLALLAAPASPARRRPPAGPASASPSRRASRRAQDAAVEEPHLVHAAQRPPEPQPARPASDGPAIPARTPPRSGRAAPPPGRPCPADRHRAPPARAPRRSPPARGSPRVMGRESREHAATDPRLLDHPREIGARQHLAGAEPQHRAVQRPARSGSRRAPAWSLR